MKIKGLRVRFPAGPVVSADPTMRAETLGVAREVRAGFFTRRSGLLGWALTILLVTSLSALLDGGVYFYRLLPAQEAAAIAMNRTNLDAAARRELAGFESESRRYQRALSALRPRGIYIVIDAARNRLYVKEGERVLHEAVCATGSGMLLRDPEGNRQWVFDTPRGLFQVLRKIEQPVWKKPDWAFIEEGRPIPEDPSERFDPDSLGDYALYFGNGYLIHGTLYERYLGRNITHGCVRLGDRDLQQVFRITPLGAPIYIF